MNQQETNAYLEGDVKNKKMDGYITSIEEYYIGGPHQNIGIAIKSGDRRLIHLGSMNIYQNETKYSTWIANIEDGQDRSLRHHIVITTHFSFEEEYGSLPDFRIGACQVQFNNVIPIGSSYFQDVMFDTE